MAKKLDNILFEGVLEKGLVTKKDLEILLKEAEGSGLFLQQVLINHHTVSEKEILSIFSEKLKFSCFDLKNVQVDKQVIEKIPVKVAAYYKFIPLSIKDRVLTIAVSVPLDVKVQDEIRTQLGYEIEVVLSCVDDIADALKKLYGLAAETLEKISGSSSDGSTLMQDYSSGKIDDIEKLAGDASVIRLVNQIILDAYKKRATDIHLEPYRNSMSLRYRIDGILYDSNVIPEMRRLLNAIISRIKIMSSLNIVERRMPQDGRAVVRVQEQVLDLRISTIPTPHGESVVIRILPTQMFFGLEKLGLEKKDLEVFEELIVKPHGIIFATGPTGSGKTTTLYACLSKINTKDRKIITIEDPIEYEMSGITQIQVMPEIGLDFARGLRSILRHDPDVIMVGEVRDLETAEIAIRVALTGHLVFSTLHTNDAASGITRLIDIGVEPYLVASSVKAFIAQRLIRLICPDCRIEDTSAPAELKELISSDLKLNDKDKVKIFKGKGCSNCNSTGYFGRTAIYETLLIDEEIENMIIKKASASQIKRVAAAKGMRNLRQDGWRKVIAGLSTPEEVMKVTLSEEKVKASSEAGRVEVEALAGDAVVVSAEEEDMYSEKRAYVRLKKELALRFKVYKSRDELLSGVFAPEQFSITMNISAGGLLFVSDEPLAASSIVELKIEIPFDDKPIECLARVVRVEELRENRKYNVGICFLDLTGADRLRLNKYIERHGFNLKNVDL